MTAFSWFRMYHEFAVDPKVQMLSEVDQRRFVMLLCLKCCNEDETLHVTEIAFQLRISEEELLKTKAILMQKNLIDDDFMPVNWDKRQYTSDSSSERVRRHREKKKNECNTNETFQKRDCNAIETETESYSDNRLTNVSLVNDDDVNDDILLKKPKKPAPPYQEIVDLFTKILPTLPAPYKLNETRKRHIRELWADELNDIPSWESFYRHVFRSDFLMGRSPPGKDGRTWQATFDWIIKPSNFIKIAEEQYHGKKVHSR